MTFISEKEQRWVMNTYLEVGSNAFVFNSMDGHHSFVVPARQYVRKKYYEDFDATTLRLLDEFRNNLLSSPNSLAVQIKWAEVNSRLTNRWDVRTESLYVLTEYAVALAKTLIEINIPASK